VTTATGEADRVSEAGPPSPYVGPRAFRAGEPFFARDREQRELADMLIAERIVLLHAPSGAGKTSLIQAGLTPLLEQRRFHPTAPLRVKTPPPEGTQVRNRYAYSVALDLLGPEPDPAEIAGLGLDEAIAQTAKRADGFLVLVFDQFEEILQLDPTDWTGQAAFFKELGTALANPRIWMLVSMREDLMGGLDRFLRYVPGHLRATFRLDFLDRAAAKVAIREPARKYGIDFTEDAADKLIQELAKVKVQRPCHEPVDREAPYVQPFQLQVVCRTLWEAVSREDGDEFTTIDLADVDHHADVPEALRRYYAESVAAVAKATGADEGAIRSWFRDALISQGLRSQTPMGPTSHDVEPGEVLRALQETYLIRSDTRADTTWWELSHDMLIGAVQVDNQRWFRRSLDPWQLAARAWRDDRDPALLIQGVELREAQRKASSYELLPFEREYLRESARSEQDSGVRTLMQRKLSTLGTVAALEGIAIVLLVAIVVVLLLSR
jgi:hypothetical protein